MNKIGKMEGQEKPKKWSELSKESRIKFEATVLKYYERYVNGGKDKKESIISNILELKGLDFIDTNNRGKVSNLMSLEKQRREKDKNPTSLKNNNYEWIV